ncbi:glucosyltransferase domain-containing protein [Latilactobacillus curvatus]|uniref:glucosyltransferase domain-containing protein n=1 Tax=Latilactobacillus curvatus TaxID=28038 RepID=UPI000DAB0C16|nr:glucosyltransferase domain-containing protein [Latilactobacillus curvatus]AWV72372.1 hypothetical protein C0W45_02035 [Latilactobacillus curvatus]
MKSLLTRIHTFASEKKKLVFFISFITLITYAPKIFYYNYSLDTETFIYSPVQTFKWWIQIDRYGLALLRKISLFGLSLNVPLTNIMTYIFLALGCILLMYLLNQSFHPSDKSLFIASLIYLTSPIILEQTNYILQSTEVTFTICLLFFSLIFIEEYITTKQTRLIIYAFFSLLVSLSVYPSALISFIILSIVLTCSKTTQKTTFIQYIYSARYYLLLFIAGSAINKILSTLALHLTHLKHSNYVDSNLILGKVSFVQYLQQIKDSLKGWYFSYNNDFLFVLTITVILCLVSIIFSKKKIKKSLYILSLLLITLAGLSTLILFGWIGPVRSLMPSLPIIFACCAILSIELTDFIILQRLIVLILTLVGLAQIKITNDFGVSEFNKYQQEVRLVNQITTKLSDRGISDLSTYRIAFVTPKSFYTPGVIGGDALGQSFFQFGLNALYRGPEFMQQQGVPVGQASAAESKKAFSLMLKAHPFPAKDSILINGHLIIIKL